MADAPVLGDDMTELYDAEVPRLDLVGKGANGMPFLIAKQASGSANLLDPGHVRDLISKSEPVPPEETVTMTMTGSPAAIINAIHRATVAKTAAVVEPVEKAKYDADALRRMAADHEAMPDESYPIADREDLDNAIRAVGRGGADHDAIRRHIAARAKTLGASGEIPDNWAADGSLKKAVVTMDMEMDDGVDGMDPTVVLAMPDEMAPGDPTDPGSPAWESVDAATARKWTSILARARSALGIMADREALEGATVDPDDMCNAMDLDDAACAIDYVISVLAPFAVDEQAEADCGTAEMAAIGKALADFDAAPFELIEGLAPVAKSGRTLSSQNEMAIRTAVESLQKVLASLPAPEATIPAPVQKEEEAAMDPAAGATETAMMGTPKDDPTPAADGGVAKGAETPEAPVAKAAKSPQMPVYDSDGNLVGVCDPGDVSMLTMPKAPAADMAADSDDADDDSTAADDTAAPDMPAAPVASVADLTPAPPAEAGTPADAVDTDDDGNVAKSDPQTATPASQDLLKSSVETLVKSFIDDYSAGQADVVKSLEDQVKTLGEFNEVLLKRLENVEGQPAVMAVMANGAVPPASLMRGQGNSTGVDLTQAQQLRKAWSQSDDARQSKDIADQMQAAALTKFAEMRAAQRG